VASDNALYQQYTKPRSFGRHDSIYGDACGALPRHIRAKLFKEPNAAIIQLRVHKDDFDLLVGHIALQQQPPPETQ
jgi:hypothetical protein